MADIGVPKRKIRIEPEPHRQPRRRRRSEPERKEAPVKEPAIPARSDSHTTVHAMTLHKSQGFQFDQVVVVL